MLAALGKLDRATGVSANPSEEGRGPGFNSGNGLICEQNIIGEFCFSNRLVVLNYWADVLTKLAKLPGRTTASGRFTAEAVNKAFNNMIIHKVTFRVNFVLAKLLSNTHNRVIREPGREALFVLWAIELN